MSERKVDMIQGGLTKKVLLDPEPLSLWQPEDPDETQVDGVGMENIGTGDDEKNPPEYWLVIASAEEGNGRLVYGNYVSLSPKATLRLYRYIERHLEEFKRSIQADEKERDSDDGDPDPKRLTSKSHGINPSHYCLQWFPEIDTA